MLVVARSGLMARARRAAAPLFSFFYQAMSEQAMTTKTRPQRATLRPGSLVSKATAARLLDCDHATIRRRVADGLPVVQTVGGERLTVRSLFPGLTDSAVEQLMRGIVLLVVLAGCQMGCADEEKLLLAGRLGSVGNGRADRGQLVCSQAEMAGKVLSINGIGCGGNGLGTADSGRLTRGEGVDLTRRSGMGVCIPPRRIISHWPRLSAPITIVVPGKPQRREVSIV